MEINFTAILPEIILSVAGILVMLLIPFTPSDRQISLGYLALAGFGLALMSVLVQWGEGGLTFFDMVFQDSLAQFSRLLFLFAAGVICAVSIHYLERDRFLKAEYFPLLLFATVGMCFMATSADLVMTFLGLEVLSIATYVLAGYRLGESKSIESALKYFILGAFSTGFLLYGVALIYGATGSTQYLEIAELCTLNH